MFLSQIVLKHFKHYLAQYEKFLQKSYIIVHEMKHWTIKNKLKYSNDYCNNYKVQLTTEI